MSDEENNKELDKLESNYNMFLKLCKSLGDRAESFVEMVEYFGERLATAPMSTNSDYQGAYVGGLVDYSLSVLKNMKKVVESTGLKVNKKSMIVVSLFHSFGLIGTKNDDLFEPSDPYWTERGRPYQYNKSINFMTSPHRSLFLLQEFGIVLTEDEWLAIALCHGPGATENEKYRMKEPSLSVLLHNATTMTRMIESKKKSVISA